MDKKRCQYSKEGLNTFGKQRQGYVVGESRDGGLRRVLWDGNKTSSVYAKDFIEINPLIELFVDDNGAEKEKPLEDEVAQITPETILKVETALEEIKKTGLTQRGLEVLVKDYVGAKVPITHIRIVLSSLEKIKTFYF